VSVAKTTYCFNDEAKEMLKEKDYQHHLKRDKFTEYTEAMAMHKKNLR